jgi:glutamine amidotransferase
VCRLTAYVGDPLPLSTLVFGGTHSLHEQSWAPRELLSGRVNADGWGVGWYHDKGPGRLAAPEPVWHAQGLQRVLEGIHSPLGMAAVRNATSGLPVAPDSVPPLVLGRWTFILNGFVPGFRPRHMRSLRRFLPDHLYGLLEGVSDAETLFLLAVERLEGGASLGEALEHTVELTLREVEPDGEECQLTMVLADGDGLALVRASNRDRVNSLYRIDGGPLATGGTLVASERLDEAEGWTPVQERTVVEIRRPGPHSRPPDPSPGS